MTNTTTTERVSDLELRVTRSFDSPARLIFEAWTKADLMVRWWVPASFGIKIVSCEMDARTGGTYRFTFSHPDFAEPMAFFGRYIEVTRHSRIVWTNEEGGDAGSVTTVTLEERGAKTLVTVSDVYPSKDALDDAIASGSTGAFPEQFDALDVLLPAIA